jgi:hypothetical protein
MFERVIAQLLTIACLLSVSSVAIASDLEREQRLASEIVDAIFDGEPMMLDADGQEFLAIYTEAEGEPKGGVVIMHGRGYHPDWVDVANPLRVGLAAQGWNTLSIQMPVLEKAAKYYDYVHVFPESYPRIEAAIEHLRQNGSQRVVLIAHSCSVHMSLAWINEVGDQAIDGYVGVGMGATDYQQPMLEDFPLADMSVPVLDIYGADEYPAVKRKAPERLAAMQKAGNPRSAQVVVPAADHYFKGRGQQLLEAVSDWLDGL